MSTVEEVPTPSASPARPRAEVLRRADGIELIGEFEDSGFKEPPNLARRADGQVIQLTDLLYAVAAAADGRRDLHEVAAVVGERTDRPVTAENVKHLADEKLRPLGVLTLPDGTTPELEKREPVMALRHRRALLPERAVNAGARLFTWLHRPIAVTLVLSLVAIFDAWLFGIHGVAGGLRSALYNPTLLLAVLASVVVATAFHEFGHASACRYSGARPGPMGVGLYLVWPAFYCDVTDAYRLNRAGRLRTDLGGVYFNAIFALLAGAVYFATGEEAALLAAVVQHIILLQQLLPLLRFDGYYVLTDLTGVPDILSRIKPIFRSLVPGRSHDPRVAELKPWVRIVVTTYLLVLLPTLAFMFAWMVMGVPRIAATVHDSFGLQVDRIEAATDFSHGAVGVVSLLLLVLPVAGMTLSMTRATRMAGRGLNSWSRGSAPRRVVAFSVAATVVGAIAYTWWPNGDYQPIRPGERGTIGEAVDGLTHAPGGRPMWTPDHALMYEQVATTRQAEADKRAGRSGEGPAGQAEPRDPSALGGLTVPEEGAPGDEPNRIEQSLGLGEDGMPWAGSGSGSSGSDYSAGSGGTWSGGTATQPGAATYPTQPAPGSTTTTEPAPSDPGTTTAPAPAPTDSTGTTTTEPAPTTTETAPTTTETTPPPTDTTDSTTTAPMLTPDSTESTTTAPDTTSP